jgi:hypothetical protein
MNTKEKTGATMGRNLLLFFLFSFFFFSCEKDPQTVPAGTVRLFVTVSHHGIAIPNAVIFRKNGTQVFPGQDSTLYDTRYVTDTNGKITLEDIGTGHKELVIYAKGIDPSWDTTQQTPVWGYQYTTMHTVTGEDKDANMTIPVSE